MATALVKAKRIEKLHELYLTHTENQLQELYLNGKFSELCVEKKKRISPRTFERDMAIVISELARSRQTELTSEEYSAKCEKWRRRLELEIAEAKSAKQIGVISNYLARLMALDGITTDGIRTGGGDVYIFQNNCFVQSQPEKVKNAEIELAEWQEINKEKN